MKRSDQRELQRRFRSQHGLATERQLRLLGVTRQVERRRLATGEWRTTGQPGVIAVAGAPQTPEQVLLAACLAGGPAAVASHQSAAWLWGLAPMPNCPTITVPRGAFRTRPTAPVVVHRPSGYPAHVVIRKGIPATDPLRTLVDVAGVVGLDRLEDLDDVVDRALATRLLTVAGIEAELARVARPGRSGTGAMRAALKRRGFAGAPHPSVLESRVLRLLHQGGIRPIGTEVWVGTDHRYRVDTKLTPDALLEVDGYTYHESPEQVTEDKRRRQRLRLDGLTVLEYTWMDVVLDGNRVLSEARRVVVTSLGRRSSQDPDRLLI